jgi:hypothetical protein
LVIVAARFSIEIPKFFTLFIFFVPLYLSRPLSTFAVRHLPEGILWTGFRAAAWCICPDELSSVLFSAGWSLIVRAGERER